jgi:DNA replication protein DnaC
MTTTMDERLEHMLKSLHCKRIAEILDRELTRATEQKSSYTELLTRLFQEEHLDRRQRSLEHRIAQAKLPERWALDTFPFEKQPGVDAAIIRQLAELDFISHTANIVLIGPTGVGKTGLASGLLLRAMENGYRGLFIRAQDLFDEMYQSLADHSSRKLVKRLAAIDLLLIDEMGYLNLRPEQTNIFFKLMEERYGRKSTLITTNLDYDDWYGFLGNKHMVKALLDRMRHHCHTLRIEGASLRTPRP